MEWRMTANGYGFLFGVMKMFWDYSGGGWYSIVNILKVTGASLAVHWLRLCLSMQGMWVQSLVREQRCLTFLPPPPIPQNIKQKRYCNKFNKKILKRSTF